jgi:hypothetical protein
MLFGEIDLFDESKVAAYFEGNYPKVCSALRHFRLTRAKDLIKITSSIARGEQITFHCFPGVQLAGNAYIFPRFIRIEGCKEGVLKVTREKSIRERYPVTMCPEDVVSYYYELADTSYLLGEQESVWAEMFPIARR